MTVGPDGSEVDWTKPPYYVRGVLRLVLENEDPATITQAEDARRLGEYLETYARRSRELAELRRHYFADSLARLRQVFETPAAPDPADSGKPAAS